MDSIRGYLFCIVAACMIAAVSHVFVRNPLIEKVLHLISGILILLTVVSPLLKLKAEDLSGLFEAENFDSGASDQMENQVRSAFAEQIGRSTETHIETIADHFNCSVQAVVTVSTGEIPEIQTVEISGTGNLNDLEQLREYITSGLGVPEDRQIWRFYETDG